MLVILSKEERLLEFHPFILPDSTQLVALEDLSRFGKLQYLLALAHFLVVAMKVP